MRRIVRWARSRIGTLDAYVLGRFLLVYVANLFSFALIFVLLDLVENLDEFNKDTDGAGDFFGLLVRYYGVNLPIVFCQILGPIACLTSGLFTLTLFQRSNELVPMLANGRSYHRVFWPMIFAASMIALATFGVEELWIPRTRDVFREVSGKRGGKLETRDQKYRDPEREILVVIPRYLIAAQRAEGVLVLPTNPRKGRDSIIRAASMEWVKPELEDEGYWLMRDGKMQTYEPLAGTNRSRLVTMTQSGATDSSEKVIETFIERRFETTLIPEDLEVREAQVVHMTLADLRRKIEESDDRGWTMKYWSRIFHPANNVILLLLGLPVIVFFGTRNIFFGAVIAACVSTGFFVVVAFVQQLGSNGIVSPALGAALGPCFFLALAISWMRFMKT